MNGTQEVQAAVDQAHSHMLGMGNDSLVIVVFVVAVIFAVYAYFNNRYHNNDKEHILARVKNLDSSVTSRILATERETAVETKKIRDDVGNDIGTLWNEIQQLKQKVGQ